MDTVHPRERQELYHYGLIEGHTYTCENLCQIWADDIRRRYSTSFWNMHQIPEIRLRPTVLARCGLALHPAPRPLPVPPQHANSNGIPPIRPGPLAPNPAPSAERPSRPQAEPVEVIPQIRVQSPGADNASAEALSGSSGMRDSVGSQDSGHQRAPVSSGWGEPASAEASEPQVPLHYPQPLLAPRVQGPRVYRASPIHRGSSSGSGHGANRTNRSVSRGPTLSLQTPYSFEEAALPRRTGPSDLLNSTLLGWDLQAMPRPEILIQPATEPPCRKVTITHDVPGNLSDHLALECAPIVIYPYAGRGFVSIHDVFDALTRHFERQINVTEFLGGFSPQEREAARSRIIDTSYSGDRSSLQGGRLPESLPFRDFLWGLNESDGFELLSADLAGCSLHLHLRPPISGQNL